MKALTESARVLSMVVGIACIAGCGTLCGRFGRHGSEVRQVNIEWRHLEVDGSTYLRCGETGRALDTVVAELGRELRARGVSVTFSEVKLRPERIAESNSILFNDAPIESLLPDLRVVYNSCQSCCGMVGEQVECRAVVYKGKSYDEVPETAIRAAALKAAGRPAEPRR